MDLVFEAFAACNANGIFLVSRYSQLTQYLSIFVIFCFALNADAILSSLFTAIP